MSEGWSEMQKGMVSNRKIYAYEQTCKNVYIYIYEQIIFGGKAILKLDL